MRLPPRVLDVMPALSSVSAPFIQRPVATILLAIAVFIGGVLGYQRLAVSALPQIDFPTIQVTAQLPGANPDTIAVLVTAPLERQFGQIPALEVMSSQSSFGLSQITLQFNLDRDIDGAAQDVQSAINAAGSTLPRNLPYPPVYAKVNPADAPIITLALSSRTMPLRALSDLADTLMAPRLSEISGVGRVSIAGGVRPAVRIQADLNRLAAYRLSLEDVRLAIVAANVAGSKGALDGPQQSYTIATNDQIEAAGDYRNVIVAYRNTAPVRLSDVAEVVDGLENARVGGWYNGEPAVIVEVRRQPGANIIETVDRLKQDLPRLRRLIPGGVQITEVHDRTQTIRASIHEVEVTLIIAAALVVLVVLLFLRTWRATLIAGLTLPLSLVATFGLMWLGGFSIDNLSLMALTIGTGFVIDDAIVMIENIVRKMEEGEEAKAAAFSGAREIGFTVISLTVSLIAVFIPLLFMTGLVGRMFREFALVLTLAVSVSALISLTFTPMLCAYLLKREEGQGVIFRLLEKPLRLLDRLYMVTLKAALARRSLMLLLTLATLALTVLLYLLIPKGFLPNQDTGVLTAVMQADADASFAHMSDLQASVAKVLAQDSDVKGIVATLGVSPLNPTPNTAQMTVTLKPYAERQDHAGAIAARLKASAEQVAGVTFFIQPVQDVQISTRLSRSQFQYVMSAADPEMLAAQARRLADVLRRDGTLRSVALDVMDGGLRSEIAVDRARAARLGLSMQQIDDTLNSAFGQRQISTIYAQANQYRVILEADPRFSQDLTALERLNIAGAGGVSVPLSAIASITQVNAPLSVAHLDQFPAVTLSFDLGEGKSLGDAVAVIEKAKADIAMPSAITGQFSADAAEFTKALKSQPWLIVAAVVAIYLVLGMLYESFRHPFTILTTLPSAGVGALLILMLFQHDLSLVALIGIILLMGIVKKNAIMMIDFALEAERNRGLSPEQAIEEACHLRFRPIMMTTLAALFGALPLAFATGPGAELRVPLGLSITGGLILSQILTLYTTPVIYLAIERFGRKTP